MKRTSIAKLRTNLSSHLRYVARGGRIRIFNRKSAVADLLPVSGGDDSTESEGENILKQAEKLEIIQRGTGKIPSWIFDNPGASIPESPSSGVLDQLLRDRRSGR